MSGVRTLDLTSFAGRPSPACDGVDWLPVRHELDIRAFGMNAYRARAGADVVEPHDEVDDSGGGHQEVYLVVRGHARFEAGGETIDAPAGTLVFVAEPSTHRRAVALEDETLVVGVGGPATFEPSEWEARWLGGTG